MKFIATLCFAFTASLAWAQKETVTIPKGVVYNYASDKIVEKAKKLITDNLTKDNEYSIVQSTLIIGPQLWKTFKDKQPIQQIEKGRVQFHVDDLILEGKMTQDEKDAKIVWNEFRKEVAGDFIIRKANEFELQYYWSVISFDIDEPLLIVETKNHNYILNLLKKDLKLMWLDEAPAKKYVKYQNGEQVTKTSKGIQETKLEKIVLLNTDAELKENSSVEDITEIIKKTSAIFDELFKSSTKSGKIMIEFELKKKANELTFAVQDDIDLDIMKVFEQRVKAEKYPNSKRNPIKIQLIFKVNAFDEED